MTYYSHSSFYSHPVLVQIIFMYYFRPVSLDFIPTIAAKIVKTMLKNQAEFDMMRKL